MIDVKFEVFYGVHEGIPGCPYTESEIRNLRMDDDAKVIFELKKYLVDSSLFPDSSGYLKAKVLSLSDGNKVISDNTLVKLSGLDLIAAREVYRGRNENKNEQLVKICPYAKEYTGFSGCAPIDLDEKYTCEIPDSRKNDFYDWLDRRNSGNIFCDYKELFLNVNG